MKRKCQIVIISFLMNSVILGFPIANAEELGGGIWMIEQIAFLTAPYDLVMTGPALQSFGRVGNIALGSMGEIYFTMTGRMGIFVFDNGKIYRIAGNDRRGFRDGPAAWAMFSPGGYGYQYNDIAIDKNRGHIYFADGLNNRIRKISRNSSGNWVVSTFGGGGSINLMEGKTAKATDVDLGGVVAVTVDNEGNVYTCPYQSIVKITPDGQATKVLVFPDDGYPIFTVVVGLDSDSIGNIYGVSRQNINGYFKYTKDGQYVRLTYKDWHTDGATWDGPIETATFWHPSRIAVDSTGTTIYGGGGDEHCLRRIKNGRVTTLQEDGTWQEVSEVSKVNSGWVLGSPRAVDENGVVYLSDTQYKGIPIRKLIKIK